MKRIALILSVLLLAGQVVFGETPDAASSVAPTMTSPDLLIMARYISIPEPFPVLSS